MLTSDSLFVGDIARPDLAIDREEGARGSFHSLRGKLRCIPGSFHAYREIDGVPKWQRQARPIMSKRGSWRRRSRSGWTSGRRFACSAATFAALVTAVAAYLAISVTLLGGPPGA